MGTKDDGMRTGSHIRRKGLKRGIFLRAFRMNGALVLGLVSFPTAISIPSARNGIIRGFEAQARSLSASIAKEESANAFVTGDYSFIVDHTSRLLKAATTSNTLSSSSTADHTSNIQEMEWEQGLRQTRNRTLGRTCIKRGRIVYGDLEKRRSSTTPFPPVFGHRLGCSPSRPIPCFMSGRVRCAGTLHHQFVSRKSCGSPPCGFPHSSPDNEANSCPS
jgi:hypothetical protein